MTVGTCCAPCKISILFLTETPHIHLSACRHLSACVSYLCPCIILSQTFTIRIAVRTCPAHRMCPHALRAVHVCSVQVNCTPALLLVDTHTAHKRVDLAANLLPPREPFAQPNPTQPCFALQVDKSIISIRSQRARYNHTPPGVHGCMDGLAHTHPRPPFTLPQRLAQHQAAAAESV